MGWFAYEPEWYDTNYTNFSQCEAQSVSLFVHYLSNVKGDSVLFGSKGNGQENGNPLADAVIFLCLAWTSQTRQFNVLNFKTIYPFLLLIFGFIFLRDLQIFCAIILISTFV